MSSLRTSSVEPALGTARRQGTHHEQAASEHQARLWLCLIMPKERKTGMKGDWQSSGLQWSLPSWMPSLRTPLSLGICTVVTLVFVGVPEPGPRLALLSCCLPGPGRIVVLPTGKVCRPPTSSSLCRTLDLLGPFTR